MFDLERVCNSTFLQILPQIAPTELFYLPVFVAETIQLRIRPVVSSEQDPPLGCHYQWSEPHSISGLFDDNLDLLSARRRPLLCAPPQEPQNLPPFRVCLSTHEVFTSSSVNNR